MGVSCPDSRTFAWTNPKRRISPLKRDLSLCRGLVVQRIVRLVIASTILSLTGSRCSSRLLQPEVLFCHACGILLGAE